MTSLDGGVDAGYDSKDQSRLPCIGKSSAVDSESSLRLALMLGAGRAHIFSAG